MCVGWGCDFHYINPVKITRLEFIKGTCGVLNSIQRERERERERERFVESSYLYSVQQYSGNVQAWNKWCSDFCTFIYSSL